MCWSLCCYTRTHQLFCPFLSVCLHKLLLMSNVITTTWILSERDRYWPAEGEWERERERERERECVLLFVGWCEWNQNGSGQACMMWVLTLWLIQSSVGHVCPYMDIIFTDTGSSLTSRARARAHTQTHNCHKICTTTAVSYTHLDVYKRQVLMLSSNIFIAGNFHTQNFQYSIFISKLSTAVAKKKI